MIAMHKGFKIDVRVSNSRWYEAEIFNRDGELFGTIVHPMATCKTAHVVGEAKRLIDSSLSRPVVRARWHSKDYEQENASR
jgi:hypothetical protein